MTRGRARSLLSLVALLGVAACHGERAGGGTTPEPPGPPAAPTPEQALAARLALAEWFECTECIDGELDAVLRLGPLAVPSLAAALHGGPSPATRELLRRDLRERHAELREYARSHPGSPIDIEADVWIDEQLGNRLVRYQVRAALALAQIGGPQAAAALRDALAGPLRADVELLVRSSLEKASARN